MAGKQRIVISKKYLEKEYINKKRSMTDIARDIGCTYSSINRFIKLFGISARTNGEHKKVDITGKKFGNWTAIKEVAPSASGHTKWLCVCKCGKELEIEHNALVCKTQYPRRRCLKCAANARQINGKLTGTYWKQVTVGANKRNIDLRITKKFAYNLLLLQKRKCALSGLDITLANTVFEHSHGESTASLDRIDSKKGYLNNNIQWVHKDVNLMKQDIGQDDFVKICKTISEYNKNKIVEPCDYEDNKIKHSIFNRMKRVASKRNLCFDISMNYMWELFLLQGKKCAISGIDLFWPKSTYTYQRFSDGNISLDRIDSSKGYTRNNVQWVCKIINIMKRGYTMDYFVQLCDKIAFYNSKSSNVISG